MTLHSKLDCIKAIRERTGLGLREAKDIADMVSDKYGNGYLCVMLTGPLTTVQAPKQNPERGRMAFELLKTILASNAKYYDAEGNIIQMAQYGTLALKLADLFIEASHA